MALISGSLIAIRFMHMVLCLESINVPCVLLLLLSKRTSTFASSSAAPLTVHELVRNDGK